MGTSNMNLTIFSFILLLFFSFTGVLRAQPVAPNPLTDIACALINCGQGTCTPSNATLLGFDCECNPGWKKIQIGVLTFPSCIVPNCTLDFACGSNAAPPPPPAPLLPLPPPLNLSDPCSLTWCGDGTCVANGTEHICKCNEGSDNLMNLAGFACFKECYFGADCKGVGFGDSPPPPPPSTSDSTKNGSSKAPNGLRNLHGLIILLLTNILFSLV